ncbi:MAG: acetyl-CoA carboxyl transferase, partial [Actinobacteria bacterium]|nr:acetyl-CoA carboxyl transferase [Actinomycetota bacterium]
MTTLAETLDALLDPGSRQPIEVPRRPATGEYAESLQRATSRSGVDESVQVAVAEVSGHRVVVIGGEFGFLAGSVGHSAADRVVAAYLRATAERLPVITLPTSGGTRMQEGTAAFFRMTDIARAAHEHLASGAVRIGWLRNPTTGGVMA